MRYEVLEMVLVPLPLFFCPRCGGALDHLASAYSPNWDVRIAGFYCPNCGWEERRFVVLDGGRWVIDPEPDSEPWITFKRILDEISLSQKKK